MSSKKITQVEDPQALLEDKTRKKLCGTLVYIGPTVIRTQLIAGRVFICGEKSIDDVIPEELHNYPMARNMFVTPAEVAKVRAKLNDERSFLHKEYMDLAHAKSKTCK